MSPGGLIVLVKPGDFSVNLVDLSMNSGNLSVIPIDTLVNAGYLYLNASYECDF